MKIYFSTNGFAEYFLLSIDDRGRLLYHIGPRGRGPHLIDVDETVLFQLHQNFKTDYILATMKL